MNIVMKIFLAKYPHYPDELIEIVTTFEEQRGPDLDQLLGGLGISLN